MTVPVRRAWAQRGTADVRARGRGCRNLIGVTENIRLSAGDIAPGFTLPDADGKEVSLADYRGRKVIVYFYPAASTPAVPSGPATSATTWPS